MTQTSTGAPRPQALFCALNPSNGLAAHPSSDTGSFALHALAVLCGVAILAAATNAITAGRLTGADAYLAWALAAGVCVGAVVVPRSRAGLASAVIAGLLCGEAYNLLTTAERVIATRDAAAAVITGTNDHKAEAAASLQRAETAMVAHRDAAAKTVALPSCAKECRALLQSQAADIAGEIEAARRARDAAPPSRSATPLADRLRLAPWTLDLLVAALLSLGANGLAAVLIAWGAAPRGTRAEVRAALSAGNAIETAVPAASPLPVHTVGTPGEDEPPRPPKGGLSHPVTSRTRGLLAIIEGNGGSIAGPQRQIAERAGISKTALNRLLSELAASGAVTVETDRTNGTRISLKAA